VAATGITLAGCGVGQQSRPNILWLIAEDFSPDLGCYGNKLVYTPNIDRFATEGVRFTNCFMTGPVCSAARSALATGMYQTSIGAHLHRSHRNDNYRLPEGVHVFTHYFRQAGYHTSNVRTAAPGVRGTGKTDFNFNVDKPYDGTDWNQRQPGQPFYAQINFNETHRAFHRSPERPIDPAKVQLPPYYPDTPAVRGDWGMYLETAQNLDVKIGKVLKRVEDEGLAEDTIVFFFADHGRPMPRGKQFLYEGGIHIPLIVRFPQKFRVEGYGPGSVFEDLVSSIDITATSLKLAGIEPPPNMEGQVMIGPGAKKRDHIIAARDRCDETVDRIRCVRTKKYKYLKNFYPERAYTQPNVYKDTSYPPLRVMRQLKEEGKLTGPPALFMADRRPPEELYDLEADPYEIQNLAGSPEHQKTLEELRGVLNRWIKETGDKGEIVEDPLPAEYKYRTQVDGWCTRDRCLATKANGVMKVQCEGKRNAILRSYVTEGGDMELKFRARSSDLAPASFQWSSITDINNPKNRVNLDFASDGKWHEVTVPFQAENHLFQLAFDLGDSPGALEFDWIRVSRKKGGRSQTVKQWDFA
jgi:N-sulfoglucosamine sulfohydrolase